MKVPAFTDPLCRGIKQPRDSVVGCKANARSQKRDICERIIVNFLFREQSSLYKLMHNSKLQIL